MRNGIAQWLRSPEGPRHKVDPGQKNKEHVARRARAFELKELLDEQNKGDTT